MLWAYLQLDFSKHIDLLVLIHIDLKLMEAELPHNWFSPRSAVYFSHQKQSS